MAVRGTGIVVECDNAECLIQVETGQADLDEANADLRGAGWYAEGERHLCPWHRDERSDDDA